jgi:hypothetical protein
VKFSLHIRAGESDCNDTALVRAGLEDEGITCATARVQNREEFAAVLAAPLVGRAAVRQEAKART